MAHRPPPLLAHVLGAAMVLVLLALWVRPAGQVSVDEGAAVLQAQAVAHGTWALEHPLASVDPTGAAFPVRDSTRTPSGYVPFAKHPAYPALLSLADRAAGTDGMVALSVLGTLGAAVAAALLARRLDERLAAPALYATALASPLLFDSTLVIAHTVGAAAAGAAAVALVRHHERGVVLSTWLGIAGAATTATVLLRGEGLLLAGAATVVCAAGAVASRSRSQAVGAGVVGAATLAGLGIDRLWAARILGGGIDLPGALPTTASWLRGRVNGVGTTLLRTSYGGGRSTALLAAGALLLLAVAVVVRRGGASLRVAGPVALAAAVLVGTWSLTTDPGPVPGLLVACPLLWFGLGVGRWADVALARGLVTVAGLFALAVAGTQYPEGGGYEWGARYLALALPLVIPVALLGLLRAWEGMSDHATRRVVGGALLAVTAVLGGVGVAARGSAGQASDRLEEAIVAVAPASHLGAGDHDGRPIVVSTELAVPQALSRTYGQARWLELYDVTQRGDADATTYVHRLLAGGIDRFTYVTATAGGQPPATPAGTRAIARRRLGSWSIVVLEPAGAPA